MSSSTTELSPSGASKQLAVPVVDQDNQSLDSSVDSEASSEGSESDSGSVKSVRSEPPPARCPSRRDNDPDLSSSNETNDASSTRSGSQSGSESVSDENESSDLNVTCKSTIATNRANESSMASPEFATPRTVDAVKPSSRSKSKSKSASPSKSVDRDPAEVLSPSKSPAILTPAKNMVLESGSTPKSAPAQNQTSRGPESSATSQVAPHQAYPGTDTLQEHPAHKPATTRSNSAKTAALTAKVVSSEVPQKKRKKASKKADEPLEGQHRLPAASIESKPPASDSKRKERIKRSDKQVLPSLESQPSASQPDTSDRKRQKDPKVTKVVKKPKLVKPKSASGDESASPDQSPAPPGPSARIAKISVGHRYQKLAMSRAKALGTIVDETVKPADLSRALRMVPTAHFNIQPTHAYRDFHKIPGTFFSHIRQHFNELRDKYSRILGATSELELTLAIEQARSRAALVVSDEGSRFPILWRFENDLSRAVASFHNSGGQSSSSRTLEDEPAVDFRDIAGLQGGLPRANIIEIDDTQSPQPQPVAVTHDDEPTTSHSKVVKKKRKKHKSQ